MGSVHADEHFADVIQQCGLALRGCGLRWVGRVAHLVLPPPFQLSALCRTFSFSSRCQELKGWPHHPGSLSAHSRMFLQQYPQRSQ